MKNKIWLVLHLLISLPSRCGAMSSTDDVTMTIPLPSREMPVLTIGFSRKMFIHTHTYTHTDTSIHPYILGITQINQPDMSKHFPSTAQCEHI